MKKEYNHRSPTTFSLDWQRNIYKHNIPELLQIQNSSFLGRLSYLHKYSNTQKMDLSQNFRVHALCPGMIASTFHDNFTTDVTPKKVAGMTPFHREVRVKEITNTVG